MENVMKGNKGEWSEVYVLCKLLGDTVLVAGDEHLAQLPISYPIVKILREHPQHTVSYIIDHNRITTELQGQSVLELPTNDFAVQASEILHAIRSTQHTTFEIPSVDYFLKQIHCSDIKSKSTSKTDIQIVIHDHRTGLEPSLGFSIKSHLGGLATLVNASLATGIVYRVENLSVAQIETILVKHNKIQVEDIYHAGGAVVYSHFDDQTFFNNLQLIDDGMPDILGSLVLYYYRFRINKLTSLIDVLAQENPRQYQIAQRQDIYSYKIKKFLVDSALGMKPKSPWAGLYDANGGYIVVREDGEIVCYHIYHRNLFEDYLVHHTKMDTPSTTRHQFGALYSRHGAWWIRLNFQIRFV